jgi:hypothetical protein
MEFKVSLCPFSILQKQIRNCAKKGHFQQVAYSVHGNATTQICFGCMKVRTNYKLRREKNDGIC